MEPVLFTLLITFLMVAAIVWVVVHVITLVFKVIIWGVKTPFRIGRHLMFNASSRPMISLRCANRRCGARLREEGRFCPRCGQAVASHQRQFEAPRVPRPMSRMA
jgi:hypothetical protein